MSKRQRPPALPIPDRRGTAIAWVCMPVGGVGVTLGLFLPWAVSGRVRRNVFEMAEIAGQVGALGTVLSGATFVIPLLCAVPTLLLALRLVRTAGLVAALVAVGALAGAGLALVRAGRGGIVAIAFVGPVVTAVAALFLLVAALATVRWRRPPRHDHDTPGGTASTPPFAPHKRDATP